MDVYDLVLYNDTIRESCQEEQGYIPLTEHCIILLSWGIERKKIFREDEERVNFLERLGSID